MQSRAVEAFGLMQTSTEQRSAAQGGRSREDCVCNAIVVYMRTVGRASLVTSWRGRKASNFGNSRANMVFLLRTCGSLWKEIRG